METIRTISVSEALEELSYPTFFERSERSASYDFVMLWGNAEDRSAAEEAKTKYPFDEPDESMYQQSGYRQLGYFDFPIASPPRRTQHARIGE
ncbi:MAG: hypothetical protein ABI778_02400 [Ignavibacteriota bacterium]